MQLIRHFIIGALVLYLLTPEVDGGWLSRTFRRIGRGFKKIGKGITKGIRNVGKAIGKAGCKLWYGFLCPAGMIPEPRDGPPNHPLSKGLRVNKCRVRKNRCKRSADDSMQGMVMYPFSDEFTDYDLTRDKQIEYEEFVFSVMSKFPLGDPEELREPFVWADANGDGRLDMDEFKGAPFMFAHYGSGVATVA